MTSHHEPMQRLSSSLFGPVTGRFALVAGSVLFSLACADGGQSFDDGKDGLGKTSSHNDNPKPTQPTTHAGDDGGPGETSSAVTSVALDSGMMSQPSSRADSAAAPDLKALETASACVHQTEEGGLEVEVRSECACPDSLRCEVVVQGDDVYVGSSVDTSGPVCPPDCRVTSTTCEVPLEGSSGVLHYAGLATAFTRDALAGVTPMPGSDYGVCLGGTPAALPSTSSTAQSLCDQVTAIEQGKLDDGATLRLDLTGAVSYEKGETGAFCEDDCCNWLWGYYLVKCGAERNDEIVLTADGTPFGSAIPGPGEDDGFEPLEVTMGCLGKACAPTCVPESEASIGQVIATLHLLPDGYTTWMGEDVFARAELRITDRQNSGIR